MHTTRRRSRSAWWSVPILLALAGCQGTEEPASASAAPPALSGIRYLADSNAAGSGSGTGDDSSAEGVGSERSGGEGGSGGAGYARAVERRDFEFPADHASHPAYRTEWWYFTGNVFDQRARHYGFELTIFRIALSSEPAERESPLATNEVWMGNLAVTDTSGQTFHAAERLSRGAPGIAGVFAEESPIVVRVEDWSVAITDDSIALAAGDDGFGIELELTGLDRIVYQGDEGLDPKGPEPGNASYYYSAPRLTVTGRIEAGGGAPVDVEGSAWMDREWSTSALSPGIAGWDWFALQLDDGRDFMFYRLRAHDGSTSPFSGGSIVNEAGEVVRLGSDSVELEVTRNWRSPATRVRYPVAWRLSVPSLDLALEIRPRLDHQELDLTVRYWEGAVSVTGSADGGRPIQGVGYLELAGY